MGAPLWRDPVRARLAAAFPAAALVLLIAPVAAGVAGILLPAFGYLPVLGRAELSLAPFRDLAAIPGLPRSVLLSLLTGLASTAVALLSVPLFHRRMARHARLRRARAPGSPLLSVPHAAAAFGLVFLIAPRRLSGADSLAMGNRMAGPAPIS
jgi:putative thiamine transport system permease protein